MSTFIEIPQLRVEQPRSPAGCQIVLDQITTYREMIENYISNKEVLQSHKEDILITLTNIVYHYIPDSLVYLRRYLIQIKATEQVEQSVVQMDVNVSEIIKLLLSFEYERQHVEKVFPGIIDMLN